MTEHQFEIREYERDRAVTEKQLFYATDCGEAAYIRKYTEQLARIDARLRVLRSSAGAA